MGNDSAADGQCALFRLLEVNEDLPHHVIGQALNSITPALWHKYVTEGGFEPYSNEKKMAGAFLIMQYGARLPAKVAREALAVAYSELQESTLSCWNDPEERRHHVQAFIHAIRDYDGTPPALPPYTGKIQDTRRLRPGMA